MTKILTIAQFKGGTGKTTSVNSIASRLNDLGYKVLICDTDGQGNCLQSWGLENLEQKYTMYDVMMSKCKVEDAIIKSPIQIKPNVDILPSNETLFGIDLEIAGELSRELLLKLALKNIIKKQVYDFIILDTAPYSGMMTINSLSVATHVLIPMEASYSCYRGLSVLFKIISKVQDRLNPNLLNLGVFFTRIEHNKETRDVIEIISKDIQKKSAYLFQTQIRQNVKLKESPRRGVPIDIHSPDANGTIDYIELTNEILERIENITYQETETDRDGE